MAAAESGGAGAAAKDVSTTAGEEVMRKMTEEEGEKNGVNKDGEERKEEKGEGEGGKEEVDVEEVKKEGELLFCGWASWENVGRKIVAARNENVNLVTPTRLSTLLNVDIAFVAFVAKIGIGLAVVVFGLIFALGDFLPSQSPTTEKSSLVETKQLTKEESSKLQAQVQEFEDILKNSPGDWNALKGAAVSYAELGEYDKAIQYLSKIIQKSPGDAEVLRVLAEVQNGKGDYDSSISSYRAAIRASRKKESLTLLQGLVDTLLASKKPSEAVGELLAARARLSYNFEQINAKQALLPPTLDGGSAPGKLPEDPNIVSEADEQIDPITLELLLAKAYAAWDGHRSDAVSVYDGLIKTYPEDFRAYLLKAVVLQGQNKGRDDERMFIQAFTKLRAATKLKIHS